MDLTLRPETVFGLTPRLADHTDHALIEATRTGHETAFAELMGRYQNSITNYLHRMLGDYDTAIDLAQETFVRLYGALDRYQTTYAFSTYIYSIATNLAISELRRRKRRRLISFTGLMRPLPNGEEVEFDPPATDPLPDADIISRERQHAVQQAITSLPDKYRAIIILRDIEGKSYEDIATILKLNEGTVKSRLNRGRNLLRVKLQSYL